MATVTTHLRGARALVDFLETHHHRHVFGLPGSSMVAAIYELQRTKIDFVPCIHESVAVAAADGYARVTGAAITMLYMLPGLANGLANLYNAWRDETPLTVIASQQASLYRTPAGTIGEGDLVGMARPFTRLAHELAPGMDIRFWLEQARHISTGPLPGPAFLSIPQDVFEQDGPLRPMRNSTVAAPPSPDVSTVARALRDATRPLIVVGGQLRRFGGSAAIERIASSYGIALAYEAGFSDRLGVAPGHPNCFGNLMFAPDLEQSADVVLVIGARHVLEAHPRAEWYPRAQFIAHVNADPGKLESTATADWVAAVDPGAFARSLLTDLGRSAPDTEIIEARYRRLRELHGASGNGKGLPPTMASYLAAVAPLHDALEHGWVVDESVMAIPALSATLGAEDGRRYIGTTGASLGWATGAAAGVALASGEPVTCVLGDGALRFGALGVWTVRARNLPVTFVVLDNGGYGSTRFFERQYVERLGADAGPRRPSYFGSDMRNTGSTVSDLLQGFGIPTKLVPRGSDARAAVLEAWAASRGGPNAVVVEMEFGE